MEAFDAALQRLNLAALVLLDDPSPESRIEWQWARDALTDVTKDIAAKAANREAGR